jgi:hypothetical protein
MQSKISVGLKPMESEFSEKYSMYRVDTKFDRKPSDNSEN